MTTPNELRLLPWSGLADKPCYLSTDDPDGYMSRLADDIEAAQLGTASELMEEASEALDNQDTSLDEMRCLARELTGLCGASPASQRAAEAASQRAIRVSPPIDLRSRRPAQQERPMASDQIRRHGPLAFLPTSVDLGQPEDCFVPKQLGALAVLGTLCA